MYRGTAPVRSSRACARSPLRPTANGFRTGLLRTFLDVRIWHDGNYQTEGKLSKQLFAVEAYGSRVASLVDRQSRRPSPASMARGTSSREALTFSLRRRTMRASVPGASGSRSAHGTARRPHELLRGNLRAKVRVLDCSSFSSRPAASGQNVPLCRRPHAIQSV
jgi:hypothetical protein